MPRRRADTTSAAPADLPADPPDQDHHPAPDARPPPSAPEADAGSADAATGAGMPG